MSLPSRMFGSAEISRDGLYRYELVRSWDATKPVCAWVMLNPSTADAADDDPTIRRCIGFAAGWGFGGIAVYNLFALRETDAMSVRASVRADLGRTIGPDNDRWIGRAMDAGRVVLAWGAFDWARGRGTVVGNSLANARPLVLGLTKDGFPRHPLYVKADTIPIPWSNP